MLSSNFRFAIATAKRNFFGYTKELGVIGNKSDGDDEDEDDGEDEEDEDGSKMGVGGKSVGDDVNTGDVDEPWECANVMLLVMRVIVPML